MSAPATLSIDDADVALVNTAAVELVLMKRIEQVRHHGHDAASDDAIGVKPLIGEAGNSLKRVLREAELNNAMAGDMVFGSIAMLDDRCRKVLLNRLATSAALTLAAMEVIERIPAACDEGAQS